MLEDTSEVVEVGAEPLGADSSGGRDSASTTPAPAADEPAVDAATAPAKEPSGVPTPAADSFNDDLLLQPAILPRLAPDSYEDPPPPPRAAVTAPTPAEFIATQHQRRMEECTRAEGVEEAAAASGWRGMLGKAREVCAIGEETCGMHPPIPHARTAPFPAFLSGRGFRVWCHELQQRSLISPIVALCYVLFGGQKTAPGAPWTRGGGDPEKGDLVSGTWILVISGQKKIEKEFSSKGGSMMGCMTALDVLILKMPFSCFLFFWFPVGLGMV